MTIKRRGAITFVQFGRFGFSFWCKRKHKLELMQNRPYSYDVEPWVVPEHEVEGSLVEFERYIAGDR